MLEKEDMERELYDELCSLLRKTNYRKERFLNADLNNYYFNKFLGYLLWNNNSYLIDRIKKYDYDSLHFEVSWNGPIEKREIAVSFEMSDGFGMVIRMVDNTKIQVSFHS